MLAYINTLNASLEAVESHTVDDFDFVTEWTDAYNDRTALINTFVNDYGLTVSSQYQDTLDELATNGAAAIAQSEADEAIENLVSGIIFEKVDEGYGSFSYVATAENTTEYNLGTVSLTPALYDADGVKAGESYASTSSWASGETVKFEAYSSVDAVEVKITSDFYEIED